MGLICATPAGPLPVLREITPRLDPGESVALVGPSGSGKTPLLKVLAGRLAPQQGTVVLAGGLPPPAYQHGSSG